MAASEASLRSRNSNGGVAAKTVKVGDAHSPSLLKLQAQRSRSLTPRQAKSNKDNGKQEEEIKVDKMQFPPLTKP